MQVTGIADYPGVCRVLAERIVDHGSELRLGAAISELPSAVPATLAPIAIATADGGELVAEVW